MLREAKEAEFERNSVNDFLTKYLHGLVESE